MAEKQNETDLLKGNSRVGLLSISEIRGLITAQHERISKISQQYSKYLSQQDDPLVFYQLEMHGQITLLTWIILMLRPAQDFDDADTSIDFKHWFENLPQGFYITNGMIKGAMLVAGFNVLSGRDKNWVFNVDAYDVHRMIDLAQAQWR